MRLFLTPLPSFFSFLLSFALLASSASIPDLDDDPLPDDKAKPPDAPCTVTSPTTGSFFDLRSLTRTPDVGKDWNVNGHDYGLNFSLNICAPLLSDTDSVVGSRATNISGIYLDEEGNLQSLGRTSNTPFFRGRKVVLEYVDGSPCPSSSEFRKTTTISFVCDRDMYDRASISFVGSSNDCGYFFEMRTAHACPTVKPTFGSTALGPFAIFLVIATVAFAVYCVGGCVYQRTVMHARGWRQIPHYSAWSGGLGFFKDMFLVVFFTLFSRCPRPRFGGGSWFKRTTQGRRSAVNGRDYGDVEGENALIDELDEEY